METMGCLFRGQKVQRIGSILIGMDVKTREYRVKATVRRRRHVSAGGTT